MENNELTSRLVTSQHNMAADGATPQIREFIVNIRFIRFVFNLLYAF